MARIHPLDELRMQTLRDGNRGLRILSHHEQSDQYPTPLEAQGPELIRPGVAPLAFAHTERRFDLSLLSWIGARPDTPAEIEQAIWQAFGSLPERYRVWRITLEGDLALDLADVLPPRPGAVTCVRLTPAERVPARMPLLVGLKNVWRQSRVAELLGRAGPALELRWELDPSSNYTVAHVVGEESLPEAATLRCRLLCVHVLKGSPWRVLAELKQASAHAILVVSGEADDLFAELYRKLLHDEPLDRALLAAMEFVGSPPRVALGLRPGAETDLLLSRMIAEQSGLLKFPQFSYPEAAPLPAPLDETEAFEVRGFGLDSVDDDGHVAATRGGELEVAFGALDTIEVAVEPVPSVHHQLVLEHYAKAAGPRLADFAAELARASTNPFSHEEHTLKEFEGIAGKSQVARAVNAALTDPSRAADALRYTQAWFERDGTQTHVALVPQEPVSLALEISARRREGAASDRFPMEAVAEFFKETASLELEIELYAAARDWRVPVRAKPLMLPRVGATDVLRFEVSPLRAGRLPLRVCVSYRNLLLQSMLLVAHVGDELGDAPAVSLELDYVASTTFQQLERRALPVLSVFENDTGDTHWIGVRARTEAQGRLYEMSKGPLDGALRAARAALSNAHVICSGRFGLGDQYNEHRDTRLQELISLAKAGFTLHQALFANNAAAAQEAPSEELVGSGGLISVARLRGEAPAIPWPMLYDRPLYPGGELKLCPHAVTTLASGPLSRCLPACAERGTPEGELTVCPLGFWGLRHQIEQPLDLVPKPKAQLDLDEAALRAFFSGLAEEIDPAGGLRIGYNASLDTAADHATRLEATQVHGSLSAVESMVSAASIRQAIRQGERALFYFFCHGDYDEHSLFFLEIESGDTPKRLGAADLSAAGPARPFLAVLNVCNSVDARSDQIQQLLTALRRLGALGVISTETIVREAFGTHFGERLVTKLGRGVTLGQAFFDLRWELLSEAGDCSGFVYTLNGSAGLRFVTSTPSPR